MSIEVCDRCGSPYGFGCYECSPMSNKPDTNAEAEKRAAYVAGTNSGYAAGLEAAAKAAENCLNVRCAKCGHPRDNHPYRHPFVASYGTDPAAAIRALKPEGKK